MVALEAKKRSFGERNFQAAELGDKRRTSRLVQVADAMRRHPGGTLPEKLNEPAELKALYRLCNCDDVTHEAILATHRRETLRSLEEQPRRLLVLHDTTELDYTTLASLEDLGKIGNGRGRGYVCHNSLVVEPARRAVVGLASQILHRRAEVPKNEKKGVRRERKTRESRLWLQGTKDLPASSWLVDVCDRGADTFEFLEHEFHSGRRFVIRSAYNRRALEGHGESTVSQGLYEIVRGTASRGMREIHISSAPGRKGRTAKISVSATAVQVIAPRQKKGHHGNDPLPLWIVRVWEPNPSKGQKPLEWLLLTNYPVETFSQAQEVSMWYECRWIIEEYHKAMKTGCGIETLQFQSEAAQQPAIALLSVIALTLLNLRDAARRPDATRVKATQIVDRAYVRVLSAWRYKKLRDDLTIHEFFYALARLGGHQNRRHDHRPGWLILWRGWSKLQNMVQGALAVQRKKCG